ncbi:MAG: hypothetical protein WCS65_09525 [Verrucomicrobiae bacterium]
MRKAIPVPGQDELPLRSVLAHTLFPGRAMITIQEFAHACHLDPQTVANLIECGDLVAVDLRTSKPAKPSELRAQHKSVRQWIRIPTSSYDDFMKRRATV